MIVRRCFETLDGERRCRLAEDGERRAVLRAEKPWWPAPWPDAQDFAVRHRAEDTRRAIRRHDHGHHREGRSPLPPCRDGDNVASTRAGAAEPSPEASDPTRPALPESSRHYSPTSPGAISSSTGWLQVPKAGTGFICILRAAHDWTVVVGRTCLVPLADFEPDDWPSDPSARQT